MSKKEKSIRYADSHAHLNHHDFDGDIDEIAEQLESEGFLLTNVAYDIISAERAVELAEKFSHMKASVGVHPHSADSVTDDDIKRIKTLAENEKVVAIGETGLDYFRNRSSKESQKRVLIEHLKIASEAGKPVIIHSRDAFGDIVPIFEKHFDKKAGGVLHCFSENVEEAKIGLRLGFYISFAGNVTYKKAQNLRDAAKVVPPDRLLVETDCPYLSPQSTRGKRNQPLYMKETVSLLAGVRGVRPEDLARATFANYKKLFLNESSGEAEIVYRIRNSIYINVTRDCTNLCTFCSRIDYPVVQGHNLDVESDPSVEEILNEIGGSMPEELVFCGFGEPTMRLEVVKAVAAKAKERGLKTRLNTNGYGSVINKRDIVPELVGLIDSVSVSLNAEDKETYNKLCKPLDPENAFDAMIDFIKRAGALLPETVVTAVDLPEGVDIGAVKKLSDSLGVKLRVRSFNMVG